jgi:hypothetical protein
MASVDSLPPIMWKQIFAFVFGEDDINADSEVLSIYRSTFLPLFQANPKLYDILKNEPWMTILLSTARENFYVLTKAKAKVVVDLDSMIDFNEGRFTLRPTFRSAHWLEWKQSNLEEEAFLYWLDPDFCYSEPTPRAAVDPCDDCTLLGSNASADSSCFIDSEYIGNCVFKVRQESDCDTNYDTISSDDDSVLTTDI